MRKFRGFGRFAGAAAILAMAVMATACSNGQSPVGPAGLGGSLDARGGVPTSRYFTAAFSGVNSVSASTSTSFTLVLTNHSSTSDNQDLGYAEIAIPAGFTATTTGVVSAGSKSWSATVVGSTIQLRANAPEGQNRLVPGEWVSVVINTTAPSSCTTFTFTTTAFKAPPADTPFTLAAGASQPTVVVTGCDVCTLGQGYWKTHPEAWPVSTLTLGTVSYDQTQLLSILGQQVQGNGLVSLAHQLIAAKLNVARGADDSAIASSITAADALIGSLEVPPVGSGSLDPSATGALNTALTNYNEGVTGPGACSIAGS